MEKIEDEKNNKKDELIFNLIEKEYLKTPSIIEAFQDIDRKDFILEKDKDVAYIDSPLSIGCGQTISQPAVVAFMIELLQPQPGDKVLDIGSGSGWTTTLLSYIVSQKRDFKSKILPHLKFQSTDGKVIAIETIPELKKFGEKNTAKYNFIQKKIAQFVLEDGKKGYLQGAPYNRILVSASAANIPHYWKEQLVINGIIVVCVGDSIWKITKKAEQEFEEIEYPGFIFVPLV